MNLDEIDHAVMLRNHRAKAIEMRRAVESGFLHLSFSYDDGGYDPASVVSVECVRSALVRELSSFIALKEAELAAIGVECNPPPAQER